MTADGLSITAAKEPNTIQRTNKVTRRTLNVQRDLECN